MREIDSAPLLSASCYAFVSNCVLLIMSTLSVVGSAWLLCSISLLPPRQRCSPSKRMLLWLSLSNLMLAASYVASAVLFFSLLPDAHNLCPIEGYHHGMCSVFGAVNEYFSLSSVIWTMQIAAYLHRSVCGAAHDVNLSGALWAASHTAAWLIPALAVAALGGDGAFGGAGNSCWIKGATAFTTIRLVAWDVPLVLSLTYVVTVYLMVGARLSSLRSMWNTSLNDNSALSTHTDRRLLPGPPPQPPVQPSERATSEQHALPSGAGAVEPLRPSRIEHDLQSRLFKIILVYGIVAALQIACRAHEAMALHTADNSTATTCIPRDVECSGCLLRPSRSRRLVYSVGESSRSCAGGGRSEP
jgi:hypothetical protein